jgi:hypothetical protein
MYAVRYVTAASTPELHIVALFAMGFPGVLAVVQTCLLREGS